MDYIGINMNDFELREFIKNYIRENLTMEIDSKDEDGSQLVYVDLKLEEEIISREYINIWT